MVRSRARWNSRLCNSRFFPLQPSRHFISICSHCCALSFLFLSGPSSLTLAFSNPSLVRASPSLLFHFVVNSFHSRCVWAYACWNLLPAWAISALLGRSLLLPGQLLFKLCLVSAVWGRNSNNSVCSIFGIQVKKNKTNFVHTYGCLIQFPEKVEKFRIKFSLCLNQKSLFS